MLQSFCDVKVRCESYTRRSFSFKHKMPMETPLDRWDFQSQPTYYRSLKSRNYFNHNRLNLGSDNKLLGIPNRNPTRHYTWFDNSGTNNFAVYCFRAILQRQPLLICKFTQPKSHRNNFWKLKFV